MMTTTNDAFETACTKAVARLLLGNRRVKEGIVLTGGNQLDLDGKVRLARQAIARRQRTAADAVAQQQIDAASLERLYGGVHALPVPFVTATGLSGF